jgi:DNA-binding GntR family transcriptional regulator
MARYRDIAEDLKQRIAAGELSPGDQLPAITSLMEHYKVPGLNTIRQAQQLLVDDGLVETRQGVGAFVLRSESMPRPVDLLAELRAARAALNRAIAALEKAGAAPHPPPLSSGVQRAEVAR